MKLIKVNNHKYKGKLLTLFDNEYFCVNGFIKDLLGYRLLSETTSAILVNRKTEDKEMGLIDSIRAVKNGVKWKQ